MAAVRKEALLLLKGLQVGLHVLFSSVQIATVGQIPKMQNKITVAFVRFLVEVADAIGIE